MTGPFVNVTKIIQNVEYQMSENWTPLSFYTWYMQTKPQCGTQAKLQYTNVTKITQKGPFVLLLNRECHVVISGCAGDEIESCGVLQGMGYCQIPKVKAFMTENCCQTCATSEWGYFILFKIL